MLSRIKLSIFIISICFGPAANFAMSADIISPNGRRIASLSLPTASARNQPGTVVKIESLHYSDKTAIAHPQAGQVGS